MTEEFVIGFTGDGTLELLQFGGFCTVMMCMVVLWVWWGSRD